MADFVIRRWDLEPYPGDQAPPHVPTHPLRTAAGGDFAEVVVKPGW
jgi:hypothetical protein